jgi:hypothetical protein
LHTDEGHDDVNGAFVRVEGTFTSREHGHLGLWPGELVQITRLERVTTRPEPAPSRQPPSRR